MELPRRLSREERGQDIAEYAVMLAVILVIVVGTIRLIGSNANNVFFPGRQFDSLRPADAVEGRCELLRDPWVVVVRSRVCHS